MKKHTMLAALAAAAICLAAPQAQAAFFQNTTGVSGPHSTIMFSEFGLPADTVITTQYSSLGATFTPNLYQNPQFFPGPNIDPTPNSLSNFSFSGGAEVVPFSIHFNTVQTSAAFAMITNFNTTLFEALLGGSVVDSGTTTTSTSNANDFYGFSGVSFDEIRVTVGGDGNMILDNLQLTATAAPEPASLTLLGLGLAGLAGGSLRRRKTAGA
jgi:hypothetical protein